MPKVYCFTSIKGGVTKTTSTVNIGHGLAQTGRRVLIIDADHQCNATFSVLGEVQEETTGTLFKVMMENQRVSSVIRPTRYENFFIVPGSMWLSNANVTLASRYGRESILKNALQGGIDEFDYILIDTPPNTELITINAWVASDQLVVTLSPSW